MQPLPIPASASSSAHPGHREDASAAFRRDDGFAERLHEHAPKERTAASDANRTNKAERAHKAEKAERSERAERTDATEAPPKAPRAAVDQTREKSPLDPVAAETVEAPVDDLTADDGDIPVPVTTTVITPGSTLADALLALVGSTSAAIDPTQATATDQDPLLAALATLLGELPDAQALPAAGSQGLRVPTSPLPADNAPQIVPSLLAMLHPQDTATPEANETESDALALLTAGTAATSGPVMKTTATTTTDAAIAAGLAETQPSAASAGMQANADDVGDQAAHQPSTPVAPVATATAATDEDTPFTIAEPRAAGEAAIAKPAAAPAARPAPEAGNPMERAVANQVSRALIRESADGSRMISLRLTPPELGTVRIDIVERAGVMTARLHAEDAGVRVALERYLPQLRQDLLAHNAPVRELQLADAWAGDLTRQNHGDQQGRTGNRRGGRSGFSLDGIAGVPVGASAPAMTTSTITADSVDARA